MKNEDELINHIFGYKADSADGFVIGLGNTGCMIADELLKISDNDYTRKYIKVIELDSSKDFKEYEDERLLRKLIGKEILYDKDAYLSDFRENKHHTANPRYGEDAIKKEKELILALIDRYKPRVLLIISAFGGSVGTGATTELVKYIKARDIMTIGLIVLPFKFERERRAIAERALDDIKSYFDNILTVDLNRFINLDEEATLNMTMKHIDRSIARIAESILTLYSRQV
ncbi:MAG: cell division protein FtsZ [Candidatus Micrarchaeota archaeon]|nr:MAG: cell division protein FtsZ [Candidatus Micrarchaeota archaeon]